MFLGRPTNLVAAAAAAVLNAVVLMLAALTPPIVIPAAVVGGVNLALFAIIALIANGPVTLAPGDSFNVQTEKGQPNFTTTVATPPAADAAPVPAIGG
jgi:hypothetical protein